MSGPGLNVPLNDPRLPALRKLRPPAFLLLCVGALNILFCLGVLGALAFGYRMPTGADPAAIQQVQPVTWSLLLTIAGAVVSGVLSIWGALSALNLRGWGLVVVGAVTAVFPLTPTCCLGIPFAGWMLWVLSMPEVKQHFT
jgi:uncharacterized membrane protein HdeD (DUF308 family)